MIGVPLSWLDAQPAGDVVIDPTTSVSANDDVWLEDTGNKNSHQLIIVGKSRTPTTDYPKKRTVIEFDVSSISSSANVINSQMKLYYYAAVRPTGSTDPWIDRWIQAHQLLVDWDEAQATKVKRLTSTNWNADWGAIDGTDADSTMESTVLFQEGETGTWKSWNLTNVTQDWVDGSATNYGVILWATNEDTDGYEMRFRSSEYSSNQPKLEVTYTEDPLKTVFFLKDHLGSIRATVEEDGDVAGYTDYDPWGYLLANRVLETGWSGQNVAQNKFTGKEWDDDFGLNFYHFTARPYDPEIGRWGSVDPMSDLNSSQTPYQYVLNSPLNFIDPDGRKEYADGSIDPDSLGRGDWFESDRINNTRRWRNANKYNLRRLRGYEEYTTIAQRADFYAWFDEWSRGRGNELTWPGTAAIVANQMTSVDKSSAITPDEIIAFANAGNEAIFNDVWSSLRIVFTSNQTWTGERALLWDVLTLYDEQYETVDPIYKQQPGWVIWTLQQMAEGAWWVRLVVDVPKGLRFEGKIDEPRDRFMHGATKVLKYYLANSKKN